MLFNEQDQSLWRFGNVSTQCPNLSLSLEHPSYDKQIFKWTFKHESLLMANGQRPSLNSRTLVVFVQNSQLCLCT